MDLSPPPPPYAGFAQRLLAALADTTALQVVSVLLRLAVASVFVDYRAALEPLVASLAGELVPTPVLEEALDQLLLFVAVWMGLSVLVNTAYFALQEGGRASATLGKRLVKLVVVDASTYEPISKLRATGRTLAKWLSVVPFGLGYWWVLWDPRRQAWHDKLASTVVLVVASSPPAASSSGTAPADGRASAA